MNAVATSNTDLCLIIALVFFGVAFVVRVAAHAIDSAFIAAGLAVLTLAFLITP